MPEYVVTLTLVFDTDSADDAEAAFRELAANRHTEITVTEQGQGDGVRFDPSTGCTDCIPADYDPDQAYTDAETYMREVHSR